VIEVVTELEMERSRKIADIFRRCYQEWVLMECENSGVKMASQDFDMSFMGDEMLFGRKWNIRRTDSKGDAGLKLKAFFNMLI
jgi:hypothetical protein